MAGMTKRSAPTSAYTPGSAQRWLFTAAKVRPPMLDALSKLLLRQAGLNGDAAAGFLLNALLGYISELVASRDRHAGTLARLLQMHSSGPEGHMSPLDCLFHTIETGEEYDLDEHRWKPGRDKPLPDAPFVKAYSAFRERPACEQDHAARRLAGATAKLEEYPGWEYVSAALIISVDSLVS